MVLPLRSDAPWQRLPWLLPVALSVSLAALDGFHRMMGGVLESPSPPAPIELSLAEPPPPAPPAPPPAAAPPLAPRPPPAPLSEPRAPAPPPMPVTQAPPQRVSPPQPAKPAPARPRTMKPELQEVSRQVPGMVTEPLLRRRALTEEEWRQLDEIYHIGRGGSFDPVEVEEGPRRAARSARLPPLTKEQWAALDRIYRVGQGTGATAAEVMEGPLRSARSARVPPLTPEQWAALDQIYHVGRDNSLNPPAVSEAGRIGALSVRMAILTPMAGVAYGSQPFARHSGMAARATDHPLPELPAGLGLDGELVATARFRIAADGSATVELTKPTAEPGLDRLLLAALQKWRFTPAYDDFGRAVASTIELRLTISAR